jgi:predicted transposase/invertase (TIGR01784 family)
LGTGAEGIIMDEELIVKPRIDVIFKMLFVENIDLLKGFLSAALEMPIEEFAEIIIVNPDLTPDSFGEKFARLDIIVTQPDGTKFNVELQNKDEHNYKERSVFNCSKLYTRDVKAGMNTRRYRKQSA